MPLIEPAKATTANTAAGAAASASKTGTAFEGMGSDMFMQLLVSQMRYQNPMAPTDGSEYLAQISQYAMVEQLTKVSQGQQEVSSYQRALIANSLIGKVVTGKNEAGAPVSGEVTSVAYRAGKPVLLTTAGELPVDNVDETRLPAA